jgi:hypothetical protein
VSKQAGIGDSSRKSIPKRVVNGAVLALLTLLLAACTEPRTGAVKASHGLSDAAWVRLLADLKAFERRIGFEGTRNFLRTDSRKQSFPFCGRVSRLYLPYSYQDPAIRWFDDKECGGAEENVDIFTGESEAVGESGTPVTQSMLQAPLERIMYVVFHEDCHDQFAFPHGFEEALCNVVAYGAMLGFSREQYGQRSPEFEAVERYVEEGARHARLTVAFYDELAGLYGRHDRLELSTAALLKARAQTFAKAARALDWDGDEVNNVFLANAMTYSRHYDFAADVLHGLGDDLPRAITFFRHVDSIKPTPAQIMRTQKLGTESSVEFVRAYEAVVVETTRKALREVAPIL